MLAWGIGGASRAVERAAAVETVVKDRLHRASGARIDRQRPVAGGLEPFRAVLRASRRMPRQERKPCSGCGLSRKTTSTRIAVAGPMRAASRRSGRDRRHGGDGWPACDRSAWWRRRRSARRWTATRLPRRKISTVLAVSRAQSLLAAIAVGTRSSAPRARRGSPARPSPCASRQDVGLRRQRLHRRALDLFEEVLTRSAEVADDARVQPRRAPRRSRRSARRG